MITELRARARKSRLIRKTYGRFRWFTSPKGLSQIKQKIRHLGWSVQCPICGWRGNEFYPHPQPNPRPNCVCPRCYSKERHRLLNLYLDLERLLFSKSLVVLDIAPGPYSRYWQKRIKKADGNYVSLDIESELAMTQGDIVDLPFAGQVFDIVICYHVLEHVPDDWGSLLEIRRVLKPSGRLFVQVPIKGDITFEDLSVTDPQERLLLYGQDDHVRQYGRDFFHRLEEAGYDVNCNDFAAHLPSKTIERFGLFKDEILVECKQAYQTHIVGKGGKLSYS